MNSLIYGSRSYAKTVQNLALQLGWTVDGFLDDFNTSDYIIGGLDFLKHKKDQSVFLGVGYSNLSARSDLLNKLLKMNVQLPSLVHGQALIDPSAKIDSASVIMKGAIVDAFVKLKEGIVIWPGAIINHDSEIDQNTFVSPGAIICGDVKVGKNCFIGAGAVVVNGSIVPDNTFIKAAALWHNGG